VKATAMDVGVPPDVFVRVGPDGVQLGLTRALTRCEAILILQEVDRLIALLRLGSDEGGRSCG
jgi:hypothetical protein